MDGGRGLGEERGAARRKRSYRDRNIVVQSQGSRGWVGLM